MTDPISRRRLVNPEGTRKSHATTIDMIANRETHADSKYSKTSREAI